MLSIFALWLPIVVSAMAVFAASSIMHTVLTYHDSDFHRLPAEDEILAALQPFNIPPGQYALPHAGSHKNFKDPEFQHKLARGPVAFMTVMSADFKMGKSLLLWFLYCLLISVFSAYITSRALLPAKPAEYLEVFRFAGTAAFGGYALALLQNSIWYKRAWSTTFKAVADGLVYALLTAGVFGWLWPWYAGA